MNLSNGASITESGGLYTYEHDHLTISDLPLEEFVKELQEYGIVDEFLVHANWNPEQVFAISSSDFAPVYENEPEPESDLETCFERVMEFLLEQEVETEEAFQRLIETVGILEVNKNAISNTTNSDAPGTD